ncbi:hypothetical protein HOE04_04915 [archaeon]|jgi:hypothetical protein|nr:hypothetical protein [archaeon]
MPLCGFNEKMLEGLTAFNEGLVEHGLIHRAEKNGETLDQAVKREISDMTRMLLELDKIEDSSKRVLTEGIVKYAMGFYLVMRSKGIENIPKEYGEIIQTVGEYFNSMDSKYYEELEGKSDDMSQLAKYLNEVGV